MALLTRPRAESLQSPLTHEAALDWAWRIWLALALLPFLLFVIALWQITGQDPGQTKPTLALYLAAAPTAVLMLAFPAALFWRTHLFRCYWEGRGVSPRAYLQGMSLPWLFLCLAGVLASVACLVTGTVLPNVLPAAVSLVIYATMWPNGHAMIEHLGDTDDPENYEEPR